MLTLLQIKERALDVFVPVRNAHASSDTAADAGPVAAYTARIEHTALFDLVVEFTSRGASFRLIDGLAASTRDATGMAQYSGCSEHKVAKYLRVMCASNWYVLKNILKHRCTFALAFDCATHQAVSYLDVRVRFFVGDDVHNCHLAALPMHGPHILAMRCCT